MVNIYTKPKVRISTWPARDVGAVTDFGPGGAAVAENEPPEALRRGLRTPFLLPRAAARPVAPGRTPDLPERPSEQGPGAELRAGGRGRAPLPGPAAAHARRVPPGPRRGLGVAGAGAHAPRRGAPGSTFQCRTPSRRSCSRLTGRLGCARCGRRGSSSASSRYQACTMAWCAQSAPGGTTSSTGPDAAIMSSEPGGRGVAGRGVAWRDGAGRGGTGRGAAWRDGAWRGLRPGRRRGRQGAPERRPHQPFPARGDAGQPRLPVSPSGSSSAHGFRGGAGERGVLRPFLGTRAPRGVPGSWGKGCLAPRGVRVPGPQGSRTRMASSGTTGSLRSEPLRRDETIRSLQKRKQMPKKKNGDAVRTPLPLWGTAVA